jgi:hypothetical protein
LARIDLTARELHGLLGPVLPHASTDKDTPAHCVIRLDPGRDVLYAVATDRYTLAAERMRLHDHPDLWDWGNPVHIRAADATAALKLFTVDKDEDKKLKLTVDKAPVPIRVAGMPHVIHHLAVTIESDDGTRLVLHDVRDPSNDPLAGWRRTLHGLWSRPLATLPALSLSAIHLAKWGKSVRKGERLAIYSGDDAAPLLILVEDHFAGVWVQVRYLDGPDKVLADSPWLPELAAASGQLDLRTATGVIRDAVAGAARAAGREVTLDDDGNPTITMDDPAPGLGPWITAEFDGTDCAGQCGNGIDIGDKIRADGRGGWLCEYCGKDDDGDE